MKGTYIVVQASVGAAETLAILAVIVPARVFVSAKLCWDKIVRTFDSLKFKYTRASLVRSSLK